MENRLLNNLPGMRDLLPEEIVRWQLIEGNARQIFEQYGFNEIRTSIIESTDLFARGIGTETDIVGKEMYTFLDQSNRSVTLRPEATASVVRSYLQNAMHRSGGLTKLYYMGPMFRYEKKQRGRWRQFYQIGAEALGSNHPAVDAELIEMSLWLLNGLRVKTELCINSVGCRSCRPRYIEVLRLELQNCMSDLCEDCRRRSTTNSLRVFDCKVESCQPHIDRLPAITDHLCRECSNHFSSVKSYLSEAAIPYTIIPRLVRGLDYYVRTAFEIVSGELGSQNALVGGGRYDGLSEVLGGPPVDAIGFALGLDRLVMILPQDEGERYQRKPELFLAYMGEEAFKRALLFARRLRHEGHICHLDFAAASLKSQMRLANKLGAEHVLIIGEDELAREMYTIKKLDDSKQWDVTFSDLSAYLQLRAATLKS